MTRILFLSDAHMMDGSFDSYTQGVIDYLTALPYECLIVKTNCFLYSMSATPIEQAAFQELKVAVQQFRPDVIFSMNRNGLSAELLDCFPKNARIITWFLDPYNRVPDELMHFSERDYVHLIMVDAGFGKVKKDDFLQSYPVPAERLTLFPFFVDSYRFYPQNLPRDTDVCFVGTAFGARQFSELLEGIGSNAENRVIFINLYLEHQRNYVFNFRDELLQRGFQPEKVTGSLRHCLEKAPLVQGMVDDQLTLEKRTRQLAALSAFNLKIYGQPGIHWIQNISTVESQLLRCFQFDYVRTYQALSNIYNTSKIAFNTQYHVSRDSGFSFRVFDIISCQALLLTENFSKLPLESLGFKEGEDFICFDSPDDLKNKCAYYLTHDEKRLKITQSAYQKFLGLEPVYSLKNNLANCFAQAGFQELAISLRNLSREQLLTSTRDEGNVICMGTGNPHQVALEHKKSLLKRTSLLRIKTKLGKQFRIQLLVDKV
jgi:hypothetical protein